MRNVTENVQPHVKRGNSGSLRNGMKSGGTMANEIQKNVDSEVKPRPKYGRGGTHNFHNKIDAKAEDIQKALGNCLVFYDQPKVKTDEECRQRLYDFFMTCYETGQLPTVEKMVCALGTVKQVVWEWEEGRRCSQERSDLIKKAKEFIATFEAEMVTNGKINPVVYIFRAKNYFGMKDQQDVVVKPENPLGDTLDRAQLEATIVQELPDKE